MKSFRKLDASQRLTCTSRTLNTTNRMDGRETDKNEEKVATKLKLLEIKAYQHQYRVYSAEKESKAVREKAESELDDLVDYADHLSKENELLKDRLLELSELKMRKQAKEQAQLLNGLTSSKDVSANLEQLRSKLSSSQNLLKGVNDSSAKNFAVDVKELHATVEILDQFKNINGPRVTSEISHKAAKLADMVKEEVEMAQEISTLLKEVNNLAIEKNYLATAISLRENNS